MLWSTRQSTKLTFLRQNAGYIFLFVVVFCFFHIGYRNGRRRNVNSQPSTTHENDWATVSTHFPYADERKGGFVEHPIPKLMEEAEEKFRKKLGSQSKTLKDAVVEYKRRYLRDPPKGFDEWWNFAQKHKVKMIDEYDGLMADLEPFYDLSGEELRRRSYQVGRLPSIDLVRVRSGNVSVINIKSNFKDSEVSARAHGFKDMIEGFAKALSDVDFPINALAEGRVLIPWEHRTYPNTTLQNSSAGIESVLGGPFRADWADDGTVWEAWRRTCTPDSSARRLYSSLRPSFTLQAKSHFDSKTTEPGEDFYFAKETSANTDWCSMPYAHNEQGHFFSDWRTISALYPVFSPAKAKGYQDIRIPSHYYYGSTPRYTYGWDSVNLELKDVDPMERPWEEKVDKVFWRGATTGGGNHPPGFSPQYHRHRFIRMSSDDSNTTKVVTFSDTASSITQWISTEVAIGTLNEEIMDAAFVKAVSAESYPGGLPALMKDHRFGDSVPLGAHWKYKYLVDLDGMSYSGRFMAFLASDSVPLKATVYEEFFSDWIQPWVHFIPLSSSYKEIYNIYAYFSGAPKSALEAINSTSAYLPIDQRRSIEGDKRLKRIARAGKRWKQTIGRKADLEAYVYRLCLEWARLWSDDRDAMTYMLN